jgi:hypothetical protein
MKHTWLETISNAQDDIRGVCVDLEELANAFALTGNMIMCNKLLAIAERAENANAATNKAVSLHINEEFEFGRQQFGQMTKAVLEIATKQR